MPVNTEAIPIRRIGQSWFRVNYYAEIVENQLHPPGEYNVWRNDGSMEFIATDIEQATARFRTRYPTYKVQSVEAI